MKRYYDYATHATITEEEFRKQWEEFKEESGEPDLPFDEFMEELVLHNNDALEEIK